MEDTSNDLIVEDTETPVSVQKDKTIETNKSTMSKKSPNQNKKFVRLPLARVKHMIKQDPDVDLVGQDAVFLIAKATEMFIEFVSKKAVSQIANTKRKTVMKRDVDTVVENVPNLCFLEGALD